MIAANAGIAVKCIMVLSPGRMWIGMQRAWSWPGEYEEGIRYFKKNIRKTDKEIELYVLLELLYQYDLKDCLIIEYEEAVKKKVEPRESLVKVYQYTKVHGELPDRFWWVPFTEGKINFPS